MEPIKSWRAYNPEIKYLTGYIVIVAINEGSAMEESGETEELVAAIDSVQITPGTPKVASTVGILDEKLKQLSSLLKPDLATPSKLEISDINIDAYTKRRGMDGKDYAVYPINVTMSNGIRSIMQ